MIQLDGHRIAESVRAHRDKESRRRFYRKCLVSASAACSAAQHQRRVGTPSRIITAPLRISRCNVRAPFFDMMRHSRHFPSRSLQYNLEFISIVSPAHVHRMFLEQPCGNSLSHNGVERQGNGNGNGNSVNRIRIVLPASTKLYHTAESWGR